MIRVKHCVLSSGNWQPITGNYYVRLDRVIDCTYHSDSGRWEIGVEMRNKIDSYIISKKEHEKLERWMDTDPISELVHELRYNPTIGIEPKKRKKEFESRVFTT